MIKKYSKILVDLPWTYNDKLNNGERGSIYKYPTLTMKDIQELKITNIAKEDCLLFMWCTWPLIEDGLSIMKSWGFEYKTCGGLWVKTTKTKPRRILKTMGRYFRGNSEFVLLGRRGKMIQRDDKSVSQLIIAPNGNEHSEKPIRINQMIDKVYKGKDKIELFARRRANKNWVATGLDYDGVYIQDVLSGKAVLDEKEGKYFYE